MSEDVLNITGSDQPVKSGYAYVRVGRTAGKMVKQYEEENVRARQVDINDFDYLDDRWTAPTGV